MVRLSEPCGAAAEISRGCSPGRSFVVLEVRNCYGLLSRVKEFLNMTDALHWLYRNYSASWKIEEVA